MSTKYPGGIISKTAPVPTGPYENGTAPGIWTLEQQAEFVKQGIWPTAGLTPNYIEDVFQTWLYTGNGSTQTITNGVNLSGRGGLVWLKQRNASVGHRLYDTVRGATQLLESNSTGAQSTSATGLTAFTSSGFSLGNDPDSNTNAATYASWTFREQPKFFDVVTYTGDGVNGRTVAHNLGAAPGCIIVKRTSASNDWRVYHREMGSPAQNFFMSLNTTQARFDTSTATMWTAAPTSTNFFVSDQSEVNASGQTYVAYLFAHNAGGFGLSGTDNVISCGSFTTNGSSAATVTLGYEPQWILTKRTDGTGAWGIYDTMRGWSFSGQNFLLPNSSGAEGVINAANFVPTATGFTISAPYDASATYIYIAIRRGPMAVPTTGTSVFQPAFGVVGNGYSGSPELQGLSIGFASDMTLGVRKNNGTGEISGGFFNNSRFTNATFLSTYTSNAESSSFGGFASYGRAQQDIAVGDIGGFNDNNFLGLYYNLGRAPGFFDVVCYTGTGVARTVAHNLTVAPELMIVKRRNAVGGWVVYSAASGPTNFQYLNTTAQASPYSTTWNDTAPTASVFTVGTDSEVNASGGTFVAYLFASCPGVSKVGSFTGTGATQVINCGFTTGARFVMVKATSTSGDWFVWDSTRGIVAGNDPYLRLNTDAAEVTGTDWVDTASTGFELSNAGGNLANSNGVSYIFLAIA